MSMSCLVTRGESAALPIPTRPSSVKTSTISHPWKRKPPIESEGRSSRSIGFVQKWGCGGTVFPRHSTTRVRTSVIFIDLSFHLQLVFETDIVGRTADHDVVGARLHHELLRLDVVKRQIVRRQHGGYGLFLFGGQLDATESAQFLDGALDAGIDGVDVQLHNLVTGTRSGILNVDFDEAGSHLQTAVAERRVAQAVAE